MAGSVHLLDVSSIAVGLDLGRSNLALDIAAGLLESIHVSGFPVTSTRSWYVNRFAFLQTAVFFSVPP